MNTKQFLTTLLILLQSCYMFGQTNNKITKDYCSICNKTDNNGKKQGLWTKSTNTLIIESYYKDDVLNGVFRTYNTINYKLTCFGEYKNGLRTGIWHYFDEQSLLFLIEKDIEKNTNTIIQDGSRITFPYKSYAIFYYPSGIIKSEGTLLYEDIESDYYEYGTWKYYNEKGELIKTENKE